MRRDALKPLLRHTVERRWLDRPFAPGLLQAFLFVNLGTFLLVKTPGKKLWSVEPGTMDAQLLD